MAIHELEIPNSSQVTDSADEMAAPAPQPRVPLPDAPTPTRGLITTSPMEGVVSSAAQDSGPTGSNLHSAAAPGPATGTQPSNVTTSTLPASLAPAVTRAPGRGATSARGNRNTRPKPAAKPRKTKGNAAAAGDADATRKVDNGEGPSTGSSNPTSPPAKSSSVGAGNIATTAGAAQTTPFAEFVRCPFATTGFTGQRTLTEATSAFINNTNRPEGVFAGMVEFNPTNTAVLVGYLGLPNNEVFKSIFLEGSPARPYFYAYQAEQKAAFSKLARPAPSDVIKGSYNQDNYHKTLRNLTKDQRAIIVAPPEAFPWDKLDISDRKTQAHRVALTLFLICSVHAVLQSLFVVSLKQARHKDDRLVAGTEFTIEDFNRGYLLMKAFLSSHQQKGRGVGLGEPQQRQQQAITPGVSPFYIYSDTRHQIINPATGELVETDPKTMRALHRLQTEHYRMTLTPEGFQRELLDETEDVDPGVQDDRWVGLSDQQKAAAIDKEIEGIFDAIERMNAVSDRSGRLNPIHNLKGIHVDPAVRRRIVEGQRPELTPVEQKHLFPKVGSQYFLWEPQDLNAPEPVEPPKHQRIDFKSDFQQPLAWTTDIRPKAGPPPTGVGEAGPSTATPSAPRTPGRDPESPRTLEASTPAPPDSTIQWLQSRVIDVQEEEAHTANTGEREQEMTEESRKAFWTRMQVLGKGSGVAISYADSCDILGVDRDTRKVSGDEERGTFLKPWQVVDTAWMVRQERGHIGGGINASACGLGKTLEMIVLIKRTADLLANSPGDSPEYLPTVIVTPSPVVSQWVDAIEFFFPGEFTVRQYYGSPERSKTERDELVLGTNDYALDEFLGSLDPRNPQSAKTIIVSTYGTMVRRLLNRAEPEDMEHTLKQKARYKELISPATKFYRPPEQEDEDEATLTRVAAERDSLRRPDAPMFGDVFDEDDGDGAALKATSGIYYLNLHNRGKIGRLICDEAHFAKNPNTQIAELIRLLHTPLLWFVSATPLISSVNDLRGYLWQLFRPDWRLNYTSYPTLRHRDLFVEGVDLRQFDLGEGEVVDLYQGCPKEFVDLYDETRQSLGLLDPDIFRTIVIDSGQEGVSEADALVVLPPILAQIQIRRNMSDIIVLHDGTEVRCGDAIPPFEIRTYFLEWAPWQRREYDQITLIDQQKLIQPSDGSAGIAASNGPESQTRANVKHVRNLLMSSFDLTLGRMAHIITERAEIAKHTGKKQPRLQKVTDIEAAGDDFGATSIYDIVKKDAHMPAPADRPTFAKWMAAYSPKLSALADILNVRCLQEGKKVLLLHTTPHIGLRLQQFCEMLGLRVLTIKARHNQAARAETLRQWRTKGSPWDVLIVSMRLGSYGLNFHEDTSDMVIIDLAVTFNSLVQALGRLFRIGQLHCQRIAIFIMHNSYEFEIFHRMLHKVKPQLAAEGLWDGDISDVERSLEIDRRIAAFLGMPFDPARSRSGITSTTNPYDEKRQNKEKALRKRKEKEARKEAREAQKGTPGGASSTPRRSSRRKGKQVARPEATVDDFEDDAVDTPTKGPGRWSGQPVDDFDYGRAILEGAGIDFESLQADLNETAKMKVAQDEDFEYPDDEEGLSDDEDLEEPTAEDDDDEIPAGEVEDLDLGIGLTSPSTSPRALAHDSDYLEVNKRKLDELADDSDEDVEGPTDPKKPRVAGSGGTSPLSVLSKSPPPPSVDDDGQQGLLKRKRDEVANDNDDDVAGPADLKKTRLAGSGPTSPPSLLTHTPAESHKGTTSHVLSHPLPERAQTSHSPPVDLPGRSKLVTPSKKPGPINYSSTKGQAAGSGSSPVVPSGSGSPPVVPSGSGPTFAQLLDALPEDPSFFQTSVYKNPVPPTFKCPPMTSAEKDIYNTLSSHEKGKYTTQRKRYLFAFSHLGPRGSVAKLLSLGRGTGVGPSAGMSST